MNGLFFEFNVPKRLTSSFWLYLIQLFRHLLSWVLSLWKALLNSTWVWDSVEKIICHHYDHSQSLWCFSFWEFQIYYQFIFWTTQKTVSRPEHPPHQSHAPHLAHISISSISCFAHDLQSCVVFPSCKSNKEFNSPVNRQNVTTRHGRQTARKQLCITLLPSTFGKEEPGKMSQHQFWYSFLRPEPLGFADVKLTSVQQSRQSGLAFAASCTIPTRHLQSTSIPLILILHNQHHRYGLLRASPCHFRSTSITFKTILSHTDYLQQKPCEPKIHR